MVYVAGLYGVCSSHARSLFRYNAQRRLGKPISREVVERSSVVYVSVSGFYGVYLGGIVRAINKYTYNSYSARDVGNLSHDRLESGCFLSLFLIQKSYLFTEFPRVRHDGSGALGFFFLF